MGMRRRFVLLTALVGSIGIAMSLGAAERGAAELETECAPKKLCISIADQANASYSSTEVDRYVAYSVRLYNGGTSNLVNVTSLTVTWADTGASSKTSLFQDELSDDRCDKGEDDAITCTTPTSLPSGGPGETYLLVFRTATDVSADDTTLTAAATAKEQQEKSKGGNPTPNDAYVTESNSTPYEDSGDHDVSFAGGGITVTLATTSAARGQSSTLQVPDDAGLAQSVFELKETDCPRNVICNGQLVTTIASGLSPVNLWITYVGPIPPGLRESNLVVYHTRTGATQPTPIGDACSGETFSGSVDPAEIPCRRVTITRLPGSSDVLLQIDVWDDSNGDWRWG